MQTRLIASAAVSVAAATIGILGATALSSAAPNPGGTTPTSPTTSHAPAPLRPLYMPPPSPTTQTPPPTTSSAPTSDAPPVTPGPLPANHKAVTLQVTGVGTAATITYSVGNGTHTIHDQELPWAFTAATNGSASVSAVGANVDCSITQGMTVLSSAPMRHTAKCLLR